MKLDYVISTCTAKDISVWRIASTRISKYISSKNYILIVPAPEIALFEEATKSKKWKIISEFEVLNIDFVSLLRKNLLAFENESRFGWYLQQFLKIEYIKNLNPNATCLIWDADTIPFKKLSFVNSNNQLIFRTGNTFHAVYFEQIYRLFGLKRVLDRSFIAQCMPMKSEWVQDLTNSIMRNGKGNYLNLILDSINLQEPSGFSEYETLGTYFFNKFPSQIQIIKKNKWIRNGSLFFNLPSKLSFFQKLIIRLFRIEYIAFEAYQSRLSLSEIYSILESKFRSCLNGASKDSDSILDQCFLDPDLKSVIQVGANDGVQNDPLRKYLVDQNNFNWILIEPIKFYADKLSSLYAGRADVSVMNTAIGVQQGHTVIYQIDPEVAKTMNGDGPPNDWAFGQGSFDPEVIKYWIRKNSFRGEEYRKNIPVYVNSIISEKVSTDKLSNFIESGLETLVVIDVQGAEFEVLQTIDWSNSPKYIYIEDDGSSKNNDILDFLSKKSYNLIGGKDNKLFMLELAK